MSFHTFSLTEDRCVHLLVKKLGRLMPEDAVRDELENLGIRVQGVLQLRSGRRDQEVAKTRPLTPHFIVSVARGPEVAKVRSLTKLCGLRILVETFRTPKEPLQSKRCQCFGHMQRYCGYAHRCVACGEAYLLGECSTSQQQLKCCSCGGNHTASYRGCAKWKEVKAALAKWAPTEHSRVVDPPSRPTVPKAKRTEPSAEQESLGSSWNHVVRGGRVVKATMPPYPNFTPVSVTDNETRDEVTTTRKKGKTAKSAPKVTVGPKQAPVAKPVKPAKHRQTSQPTPTELVAPSQPAQSPLEEISDLLDNLPIKACVELTRRLLTSVPTLPAGPARSRAALKIVVLFVAEYGSTA
jgi:predicted  nucleic acid-binding Zn-ribbon protein